MLSMYLQGLLATTRVLELTQERNEACGDLNNTCNGSMWTTDQSKIDIRFVAGIEDFTVR